jgi:hypothetical protein
MDFFQKLNEVVETLPSHRRFKELEALTGVKARTWINISSGKQKANHEHIEALGKAFPQYAYWLVTGLTDEAHGHTSPVLERIQQDLRKAGREAA